jgi:hypothetical protein
MTPEQIQEAFERSDLSFSEGVVAAECLQMLMNADPAAATFLIRRLSGSAYYRMGLCIRILPEGERMLADAK